MGIALDIYEPKTRSRVMASIGSRDTKPEVVLRKSLHAIGLRYRLHVESLPGQPDLCFRKHNAVVFVNGCFWHAHGCYRSSIPKTHSEFWSIKFERNKDRDTRVVNGLRNLGWRVLIVWECALIGKKKMPKCVVANIVKRWLVSEDVFGQVVPE